MSRSISLWRPSPRKSFDDAGICFTKYVLPPQYIPGPYESYRDLEYPRGSVPSLQSCCLNALIEYPDQLWTTGPRLRPKYLPTTEPEDYDILQEVIPMYEPKSNDEKLLRRVDPRIWALLVQLFHPLPDSLRVYDIPLSDIHIPVLQQIPPTPDFSLVTILNLRSCLHLTDVTVMELQELHGLGALDVSLTRLSSYGILRLSKSLIKSVGTDAGITQLKGPWRLRILCMRDCVNIKSDVIEGLLKFPLLSVVDLRGTSCAPVSLEKTPFHPSKNERLYHPHSLLEQLSELAKPLAENNQDAGTCLFSHSEPYYLSVKSLHYVRGLNPLEWRSEEVTLQLTQEELLLPSRYVPASRFYAPLPAAERHRTTLPRFGEYDKGSTSLHEANSLTLFRQPPPWSILKDLQSSDKPSKSMKRARTDLEMLSAKKGQEVKQALRNMMESRKRRATGADGFSQTRQGRMSKVSINPFLRKMPSTNAFIDDASSETSPSASTTPLQVRSSTSKWKQAKKSSEALEGSESDLDEGALVEKSTFDIPPPTTKPLRPISTLVVPERPVSEISGQQPALPKRPPESHTIMKNGKKSQGAAVQMTLATSFEKQKSRAEKVSTSTPEPGSISKGSKSAELRDRSSTSGTGGMKRMKGTESSVQSRGRRESSGPTKFDWGAWRGS